MTGWQRFRAPRARGETTREQVEDLTSRRDALEFARALAESVLTQPRLPRHVRVHYERICRELTEVQALVDRAVADDITDEQ
jgi:hypothetical protein